MRKHLQTAIVVLTGAFVLSGCTGQNKSPSTDITTSEIGGSQLQRAIHQARHQASVFGAEPYWQWKLADLLVMADSLDSAEAAYTKALAIDDGYPAALLGITELHYNQGRHAEAIPLLQSAINRTADLNSVPMGSESSQVKLRAALALHYEAFGDAGAAEDIIRDLKRNSSGWNERNSLEPYVLLRGEDFRRASEPAKMVVTLAPGDAVAQNNYGITLLQAGEPDLARDAFMKAIEMSPNLPGPYYNMAILERFYLFNDDEAMVWLERYGNLATEDPDQLWQALSMGDAP